jgi:hypothetical protein
MEVEQIKRDPESPAFTAFERQLADRGEKLIGAIGDRFAQLEKATNGQPVMKEIRQLLNAAKYVQGLMRDLQN